MSHTGISQPGGPSSQRWTSSGLVCASQTRWRGASNERVMTISRSVGVVISSLFGILGPLLLDDELVEVLVARLHTVGHSGGDGGVARFPRAIVEDGDQCGDAVFLG